MEKIRENAATQFKMRLFSEDSKPLGKKVSCNIRNYSFMSIGENDNIRLQYESSLSRSS